MSQVMQSDPVEQERKRAIRPNDDMAKFLKKLRLEVWVAMRSFFRNKSFHAGGPIPARHLYNESNFRWVVSTPMLTGIDLCYAIFEAAKIQPPRTHDEKLMPYDIHLIIELLRELRACGIRAEFHAGMMVVYFKVCHGVRVPDVELNIAHLLA